MYSYISGQLVEVNEETIVVDNHGIGYEIFYTKICGLPVAKCGRQCQDLYLFVCKRRCYAAFFGFRTKEELALFKLLIGVNGIGPRGLWQSLVS